MRRIVEDLDVVVQPIEGWVGISLHVDDGDVPAGSGQAHHFADGPLDIGEVVCGQPAHDEAERLGPQRDRLCEGLYRLDGNPPLGRRFAELSQTIKDKEAVRAAPVTRWLVAAAPWR